MQIQRFKSLLLLASLFNIQSAFCNEVYETHNIEYVLKRFQHLEDKGNWKDVFSLFNLLKNHIRIEHECSVSIVFASSVEVLFI
jgi:hypothetical protein